MRYIILFSFLFLTACGTPQSFDIGAEPIDAEKRALKYVLNQLKDPESAKNVSTRPAFKKGCHVSIYGMYRGWTVPVSLNAKNAFGGYAGQKTYFVWFQQNRITGMSANSHECPEAQFFG